MVATVLILLSTEPLPAGHLAGNSWIIPTLTSGERARATCLRFTNEPPKPRVLAAIIGREIAMSALREWAATLGEAAHKAVAVTSLGKWKTASQVRHWHAQHCSLPSTAVG